MYFTDAGQVVGTTKLDKDNVYTYRMQSDPRYKFGLYVLSVNGETIAHGPKGKINALMRLLNDSEIDVPEAEKAPVNNYGWQHSIDCD